MVGDVVGVDVLVCVEGFIGGDILLLENICFDKCEISKNDDDWWVLVK